MFQFARRASLGEGGRVRALTNMKIDGGATLWARKTIESDLFMWRSHVWFKIWFYIVNEVNHREIRHFQRGEGLITYLDIRRKTGASHNQVKHCIEYLKNARMIATRKTTRGMIVKVLNYDKYQSLENYKSHTKSHTGRKLKAIRKPFESHTINKNDKNDKNDIYSGQSPQPTPKKFIPPSLKEVEKYCQERNRGVDPDKWHNFYTAKGWMVGKNKMKDWRAAVRTWEPKQEKQYFERPAPKMEKISEEDRKKNLEKLSEMREKIKAGFKIKK